MADGSFAELTMTLPPMWPAPDSPDFTEILDVDRPSAAPAKRRDQFRR